MAQSLLLDHTPVQLQRFDLNFDQQDLVNQAAEVFGSIVTT
jgi:hypothetical protein